MAEAATKTDKKESTFVVYAALVGNLLVVITKAVAAVWTGSSAMTSEAIHSFVDTFNEILLLYGMKRAAQKPDLEHPYGYGRELYFWSFMVALMVFAMGAIASVYQGVTHLLHPEPMRSPLVSYVVLGAAFVFEAGSWVVSFRSFRAGKGRMGFYEAFVRSKNPPTFMVLLEDSAALLGILVAAIGTVLSVTLHSAVIDGAASIVIGLILATTAALLLRESKSLLLGETAAPELSAAVLALARAEPGIAGANGMFSVQLGPEQVVVALSIEFGDELKATAVEDIVVSLERKVRAAHPEVVGLFVKPQDHTRFDAWRRARVAPET